MRTGKKHLDNMVERRVTILEKRVDRAIPLAKYAIMFQMRQLARAEQLRKLVARIERCSWRSSVKDSSGNHSGYVTAVDTEQMAELRSMLRKLTSFHKPRKLPHAVKRMLSAADIKEIEDGEI